MRKDKNNNHVKQYVLYVFIWQVATGEQSALDLRSSERLGYSLQLFVIMITAVTAIP